MILLLFLEVNFEVHFKIHREVHEQLAIVEPATGADGLFIHAIKTVSATDEIAGLSSFIAGVASPMDKSAGLSSSIAGAAFPIN